MLYDCGILEADSSLASFIGIKKLYNNCFLFEPKLKTTAQNLNECVCAGYDNNYYSLE